MDLGPIGQALGAIGLAGGLILALIRYLTSDGGYRDLIAEQRQEIGALREEIRALRDDLEDARKREEQMAVDMKLLRARFHPPPPPSWAPPKG